MNAEAKLAQVEKFISAAWRAQGATKTFIEEARRNPKLTNAQLVEMRARYEAVNELLDGLAHAMDDEEGVA